MKKYIGLLMLFSIFGCSNKDGYQTIEADAAVEKIEQGTVLIDVREVREFKEGHIEHSINIPLDSIVEKIGLYVTDKDQEIILYCRSGNRSKQAANKLLSEGYTSIYDLGGITQWPFDIVK